MKAYQRNIGAPDLALWQQSLAKAERAMGPDHPRLWMHTRELYKKAGGGEVPGLNAQVGEGKRMPHGEEIQLLRGIEVEKEHASTLEKFARMILGAHAHRGTPDVINDLVKDAYDLAYLAIAQDHLKEIPDYYDRLAYMEREAKGQRPAGGPVDAVKRGLIHLGTKMRTINLPDDGSGMDGHIQALAAAADRDEQALRSQVGVDPDQPWYADEWRG